MIPRESLYKNYDPSVAEPPSTDAPSYWFVFDDNQLLLEKSPLNALPLIRDWHDHGYDLRPQDIQYLGTLYGKACYCAAAPVNSVTPETMVFSELRPLYSLLEEDVFLLAGRALQIVTWHMTHQFCSKCGATVLKVEKEMAKRCAQCGFTSYPKISPAVITAIFKGDQILLAHNHHFPENLYSLVAGFVEPGETLEECVIRETMEEVNVLVTNVKYIASQPWPFPHSLMIGFTADYESGEVKGDGIEIAHADWFHRDNMPEIPSKVSIARKIIDWYMDGCKS